jgi:hypothetical protein
VPGDGARLQVIDARRVREPDDQIVLAPAAR